MERNLEASSLFLKKGHLLSWTIAMAHQIRAISKDRLGEKCGRIEAEDIKGSIREAIKLYLDIE